MSALPSILSRLFSTGLRGLRPAIRTRIHRIPSVAKHIKTRGAVTAVENSPTGLLKVSFTDGTSAFVDPFSKGNLAARATGARQALRDVGARRGDVSVRQRIAASEKLTSGEAGTVLTKPDLGEAITGRIERGFREHPILSTILGTATAGFAVKQAIPLGISAVETVTGELGGGAEELLSERRKFLDLQRTRKAELRRLSRLMGENAARLAAVRPDLYNRVVAGRRLPPGGAVFGGQPRTDLLEQLTLLMSTGRIDAGFAEDLALQDARQQQQTDLFSGLLAQP